MDINNLLAELFKSMAHPLRIKILINLSEKENFVCELAKCIGEGQPQVSRALAQLKDAGLIVSERKGNKICYKLSSNEITQIINSAKQIIKRQSSLIIKTLQKGD